jgi:hypothetical protein
LRFRDGLVSRVAKARAAGYHHARVAAPPERNSLDLIRDAAGRARALRDAVARDGSSVTGYDGWPGGAALYGDVAAALDRVISGLDAGAEPSPENPAPAPESPSP